MMAAICDDDMVFRKQIHEFLVEYKRKRRIHLDIVEFPDGESLLNYEHQFDIVFLDNEMPGLGGLETARLLRARKCMCCIIYVTSYEQYIFDAFTVSAYRYIMKPVKWEVLAMAIDDFLLDKKKLQPILINTEDGQVSISSAEIMYLEADHHACYIRTNSDYIHSYKPLGTALKMLPAHCFYRVHKSYAVNMYSIHKMKGCEVILFNGERIPISRTKITDFKTAYKTFLKYYIARR